MPTWLYARLSPRLETSPAAQWKVVLPTRLGNLREPTSQTKRLRPIFDRVGLGWATSHTLRKTAATRLDEPGFSGRQVAQQLGHARPSITTHLYMSGRDQLADVDGVL